MSPEFGVYRGLFSPDAKTLEYLEMTGREKSHIETTETYLKANLLWRENEGKIRFTEVIGLDLSQIESSVAGPRRPQDKISLTKVKEQFIGILKNSYERDYLNPDERQAGQWANEGGQPEDYQVGQSQAQMRRLQQPELK